MHGKKNALMYAIQQVISNSFVLCGLQPMGHPALRLYIHLILSCRLGHFGTLWATVCSSWVQINCFTSCRSLLLPEGDTDKRYVSLANTMMSRHLNFSIIKRNKPGIIFGRTNIWYLDLVSPMNLHEPYPAKVCPSSRAGAGMRRDMVFGATPFQSDGWIREDAVVLSSLQSDVAECHACIIRVKWVACESYTV